MIINGYKVTQKYFAYDGCHKIYLLDEDDIEKLEGTGYDIIPIEQLQHIWEISCPLRFINTWKLQSIVQQGERATFIHRDC